MRRIHCALNAENQSLSQAVATNVRQGLQRNDNNNNEILIKREPLAYTRARRTVQKKEKEKRKAKTVQQQ